MIAYLHGFNSSGSYTNHKVQALKLIDPKVVCLSWDSGDTLAANVAWIKKCLKAYPDEEITLVGTSMGGLIAHIVGNDLNLPRILLNPSVDPHSFMKDLVCKGDQTLINYVTGQKWFLSEYVANSYKGLRIKPSSGVKSLVILADDDETLSADVMAETYKSEMVLRIPEGGHRMTTFETVLLQIRNYISSCEILGVSN